MKLRDALKSVILSHAGTLGVQLANALVGILAIAADKKLGDLDGDGIPNFLDPDKDGDGVPNREDAEPKNPNVGRREAVEPQKGA